MQTALNRPRPRGRLRMALGTAYFSLRRHLYWYFAGIRFAMAAPAGEKPLPHLYFAHETPLIRQLKDVEMVLQYNKVQNLKLAVPRLNRVILRPGETLSYWKRIGKPTRRKGYLDGMVLYHGSFRPGIGGGLCQLSNLIYWMTLHTPLTVIERHRHAYDVFPDAGRTQPFGSGATCFYNYGDLMIRNDTPQTYQLLLEVGDTHLKGAWMSEHPPELFYEVYEKEHRMQPEYWGGYTRHNVICRRISDRSGKLLRDEPVTENHAYMMYSPFLEQGK